MKLVIGTQYFNENGKAKWGETYVVLNLTQENIDKIKSEGLPHLKELLEYQNGEQREYICDYQIVPDVTHVEDTAGAPPIILQFLHGIKRWYAIKHEPAADWWNPGFTGKTETWLLKPAGGREDYRCTYHCEDGVDRDNDAAGEYTEALKKKRRAA